MDLILLSIDLFTLFFSGRFQLSIQGLDLFPDVLFSGCRSGLDLPNLFVAFRFKLLNFGLYRRTVDYSLA